MGDLAILVLEDGSIFQGTSIGAPGITCGEVVFNTAMYGYQEIISDPSYAKQIITFTYPHIGNVGVNSEDEESKDILAAGIVVSKLSSIVSSWRAERSLVEYIKERGVVGIANIDTRALTRKLRDAGTLRGCIMAGNCNENTALALARSTESLSGKNLASIVSVAKQYEYAPKANKKLSEPYRVVVFDFGVKHSILHYLANFGCRITVVPANTNANKVLDLMPDGIVFSNGPGDPSACNEIIATIRTLLKSEIPMFGICLGHQLLALALGANTIKMKFGHHGANHPVQDLATKKIMITSQNHGFTVDEASLPATLKPTHCSLFDGSLQGFRHATKAIYAFQGHPEAGPGPHDALSLFEPFIAAIKVYSQQLQHAGSVYA